LLVRTFCRPGEDEVVTHRHAFISYAIAARTHGAPLTETPVRADLRVDVDALCAAIGPRTRLVFIANPNNPTGHALARDALERILAAVPPRALPVLGEASRAAASPRG